MALTPLLTLIHDLDDIVVQDTVFPENFSENPLLLQLKNILPSNWQPV
jgi:hypothetical protein